MSRRGNPYARPDARTRSAKASGYPARSVYKLREIDQRFHLLKGGQRVLDLGAAPGSWSQYTAERIGASGRVLAVDLSEITHPLAETVTVVRGDALDPTSDALRSLGPYDVVLSDMAPSTSGSKLADQARSFELYLRALDIATELGKPGSSFVGKLFMSEDFQAARRATAERYRDVKVVRPEATRSHSSEVFVVAMGLRRPPPGPT